MAKLSVEGLRSELTRRGISYSKLAATVGAEKSTIGRTLTGATCPTGDLMTRISVALGQEIGVLFAAVAEDGDPVLGDLEDAA